MSERGVFISSLSRRQLARRRALRWRIPGLRGWRAIWLRALPPAAMTAVAGFAAYVAGRGGL
jgi:hypothetical protein